MTTMDRRSIEERMKERAESCPDEFTNAWWRRQFEEVVKGYRGLTHACDCVLAENADLHVAVKELKQLVMEHSETLEKALAAVGELQSKMVEMKEAYKKAREAYSELKAKVS